MKDARDLITRYYEGKVTLARAAEAVLRSGWDFTDPDGGLKRKPDEVAEILYTATVEIQLISDMSPQHRALIRFIFHAYLRALDEDRNPEPKIGSGCA